MATGDFSDFLASLGAFESGINTLQTDYPDSWFNFLGVFDPARGNVDPQTVDTSDPADLAQLQYHVHNTLGFLGKYQFGEPLLIDLGYYTPAPTGFYGTTATNEWQGTWTGKNGVNSKEDFMSEVQELAIREAFAMNMGVIDTRLAQAGHTLDDFLGESFTYTQGGETHVAVVTISGILASAHLQGPGGVANLLLNGVVSHDEYGTNILSYMDKFGEFSSPFGTAGNDVLSGSDYSETFDGGTGENVYTTGDGDDKIVLTDNASNHDVITDFDVAHDVVSLQSFTDLSFADLALTNTGSGTVVTLPNGQTVEFEGVTNISAANFVNGYYVLGWSSNSGDTVIQNFNTTHDIIDLNYAFASNNLSLYEENGNAVIEVVGNNQRMILEGVPLSELKPYNFIKAPLDFAQTNFTGSSGSGTTDPAEPPAVVDPDPVDPTPSEPPATAGGDGTAYAFTWNWGANAVISDFDVSDNTVDLQSFWTNYSAFEIYDNADGNAVIDLTAINNQTITIENVARGELTAVNFTGVSGDYNNAVGTAPAPDPVPDPVPDPTPEPEPDPVPDPDPTPTSGEGEEHAYTWSWGAHDVISDFDVSQDSVDLSGFWTSYQNFTIYTDAAGNAVIDLTDVNNQSITLAGVSAESLTADNVTGVSGNYLDALEDAQAQDTGGNTGGTTTTPADVNTQQAQDGTILYATDGVDAFAFGWNWGSHTEIEGFNSGEDFLDLQAFWTTPDNVQIYNDLEGNAVIDLTDLNNQTITLNGVSAEQLSEEDILY